jgi:polysaccharide deacetylase family protein (PEP-CTERM system associated)
MTTRPPPAPRAAAAPPQASGVTFTLDLEDHRADKSRGEARYGRIVPRILDFLAERGVRGTVFTVGSLAREAPALIRDVVARGHELGYHTRDHVPLTDEDPRRFHDQTRADKEFLEDLAGAPVRGFRAPVFSLTRQSLWALDVLKHLGFEYSSSIMPGRNPLYSFPGAPEQPFRWPQGLLELPCPLAALPGGARLAFLGGVYLRYLPLAFILARLQQRPGLWTYCHPYDFDAAEPFCRVQNAGLATSLLVWLRRGGTFQRMERLLAGRAAPPLAERIAAGEFASAPTFTPSAG